MQNPKLKKKTKSGHSPYHPAAAFPRGLLEQVAGEEEEEEDEEPAEDEPALLLRRQAVACGFGFRLGGRLRVGLHVHTA